MVDQARGERGLPGRLLGAIAFLSAISAVSTDLYLPSFPQMADDLGTDQTGVQLTLTAFLVGVAVGQLLLGPLSDRFGRRPPLVAGVLLCAVAAGWPSSPPRWACSSPPASCRERRVPPAW